MLKLKNLLISFLMLGSSISLNLLLYISYFVNTAYLITSLERTYKYVIYLVGYTLNI